MIVGLDSAMPPTSAQVQAASAAGISLWSGYLQTRSGVGLYHGWSQADFALVKQLSGKPIAFCSGWDDPVALKALAASWSVRLCLDIEGGIRADGSWVQAWLDASGAGLYGNLAVHRGRIAPFHVMCWYVADPQSTFVNVERPNTPCGWQWQNSHNEFGITVDRAYYDNWFGGTMTTDQEKKLLNDVAWLVATVSQMYYAGTAPHDWPNWTALKNEIDAIKTRVDSISPSTGASPKNLTGTITGTLS